MEKILSPEDAERFYREEKNNIWYREILSKLIEHKILAIAMQEELWYNTGNSELILESVAKRTALRELKSKLRLGADQLLNGDSNL